MADWIRRSYDGVGLTQVPPGHHLRTLQARYGGTVMLLIDVSGSMCGSPLVEAVRGARAFVSEAIEAHYEVGVLLWNHAVVEASEPSSNGKAAEKVLRHASASGGNDLLIPLRWCHDLFRRFDGDRVVAIFGDGDLTPKEAVLQKVAEMKAENIRFVTRGLGAMAAREFGKISSEEPSRTEVKDVRSLAAGIAAMAGSLRKAGSST